LGQRRKEHQLNAKRPIILPDPRPTVVTEDGISSIAGFACTSCGHALAVPGPWCPVCQSDLEPRRFGPMGVAWSSTVFRVPLPNRVPPWVIVWMDFEDGPRVLVHADGPAERVPVGASLELIGTTVLGDPLVRIVEAGGNNS
jgi:uncharacterized OB-fold protein